MSNSNEGKATRRPRRSLRSRFFATSVLLLVATCAGAASATDRQQFERWIGKYALRFDDVFGGRPLKPRSWCVCTPTLSTGFLYLDPDSMTVVCLQPTFGSDGSLEGTAPCLTYQVLSR